jgi:Concanavalin A-like lectin/glucanases superfamily
MDSSIIYKRISSSSFFDKYDGTGWCVDFIGFSSSGQIVVAQWGPAAEIVGPVLPINVWTHVVVTYSPTNAVRLYINGRYYNSTNVFSYGASGSVNILTLANPLQAFPVSGGVGCSSQSIVPTVYYGYIT